MSTSDPIQEKTRQTFEDLKESASTTVASLKDRASQVAATVGEKFERQKEKAADRLNTVASTLHDKADSIAAGGTAAANAAHRVADGAESTASYLRDKGARDIGSDIVRVARNHPAEALACALAAGFLLGRASRRG